MWVVGFVAVGLSLCGLVWWAHHTAGRLRAHKPTRASDAGPVTLYEVAYLAGGPHRVVETVLALLHESGRLEITPHGLLYPPDADWRRLHRGDGVETAIFGASVGGPPIAVHRILGNAHRAESIDLLGVGLAYDGLAHHPRLLRTARRAHTYWAGASVATLAAGGATVGWQLAHHRAVLVPVLAYTALSTITGVACMLRRVGGQVPTDAGARLIHGIRSEQPWHPPAIDGLEDERAVAVGRVALDGLAGLPPENDLVRYRHARPPTPPLGNTDPAGLGGAGL
ncbi:TIGR04222 domain-containing membrane protein [Embleya scabrispora]|uniref:TIGR04222 domain-containing membrane protein n=1 Tax=Embleya scabrispora TaxID=159449 RepID=UPI0003A32E48|nr:TIGR04222 domain-containing membrane protein [Embleya scabrispora]MYS85333.1 TIGR04222 domain-containing membrane protein [Streptomyces sp. SID5474]